jgi:hypothetical protein
LGITLFCDTRFHFGFPWILGLRVGHWQRERERERERERAPAQMLFDGSENFCFGALRVRVKEGITSMTSSHRQLLLLGT